MPLNTMNSLNHYSYSNNKVAEQPKTNGGKIFVVEQIHPEQVRASNQGKYGQELLNPSLKSLTQLFFWDIGYLFIILMACILWSVPITAIPITNLIDFPSYWWEMLINGVLFANSLYVTGLTIAQIKIIFDIKISNLLKPFLWSYILHYLSTAFPFCISYLIWTTWLGYNYPIPFIGLICYILSYTTHYAAIWFMFPKEMRKSKADKRKILAYVLYRLWLFFGTIQRQPLNMMIGNLGRMQWIMAIVLPMTREINLWAIEKIWNSLVQSNDNVLLISNIAVTVLANLSHAVWVAIVISTKTSRFTTYCVLAVDVLFNIHETYRIIKRRQKVSSTDINNKTIEEWKRDVIKLTGIEIVEFLTPIAYSITFAMAFHGLNADIIGGLKFSDWQYKEIIDIHSFLSESGLMFVTDFTCMVVTAILLWKFSSVNILEEGYKLLSFYWPLILINMAGTMQTVIKLISL